jgi:dihydrofolate reductase
MRKLVITENVTLDGSVEMLDDWFDPQLQDEDLLEESHRQDSQADALLVGRQTFEDFRGYWPKQTDDPTGVTDYLNRVAKYVVSSTMSDPDWQNSTVLTGDPIERITELKSQPGKDIVLTGSISLAHAVIAGGVVDEYRAGPRPSPLSRRDRDPEPHIGRAAEVLPLRHHALALRRLMQESPCG